MRRKLFQSAVGDPQIEQAEIDQFRQPFQVLKRLVGQGGTSPDGEGSEVRQAGELLHAGVVDLGVEQREFREAGERADLPNAHIGDAAAGELQPFQMRQGREACEIRIGDGDAVAGQIDGHQIARGVETELPAALLDAADGGGEVAIRFSRLFAMENCLHAGFLALLRPPGLRPRSVETLSSSATSANRRMGSFPELSDIVSYSVHGARIARCISLAASSSPTIFLVFGSQVIFRLVRTAMSQSWLMVSLRTA